MRHVGRTIATILVFASASAFSAVANAGWVQGIVTRIYVGPELGNAVAVKILPNQSGWVREGRPACSVYDEFAFDASTPAGQRMYAMLVQASFSDFGRLFEVYGTGTCTITGDREDVRFIYFCSAAEGPHCVP